MFLYFIFKGKKGSREFKPEASEEFQVTYPPEKYDATDMTLVRTSS